MFDMQFNVILCLMSFALLNLWSIGHKAIRKSFTRQTKSNININIAISLASIEQKLFNLLVIIVWSWSRKLLLDALYCQSISILFGTALQSVLLKRYQCCDKRSFTSNFQFRMKSKRAMIYTLECNSNQFESIYS